MNDKTDSPYPKYRYSYSKTRGLFGGVSVEGSLIVERQDANVQAYHSPVTARLLLGGTVDPPPWATPLIKTLEACTGMPGGRGWVNEDAPRTPGGTYIFGGGRSNPSSGIRTPSFLRKKKKSDTSFPPASWGEESDSGSYFSKSPTPSHSRNLTWSGGGNYGNFDTNFESDFNPYQQGLASRTNNSYNSRNGTNPFSTSSFPFDDQPSRPEFKSSLSNNPSHIRATSYDYSNLSLATGQQIDSLFPSSASHPPATSQSTVPFIRPREELTKPLSPYEGLARAIALYDFNAVEASF